MKKVFIAVVTVIMFACSNTETNVIINNSDTLCTDSVCVDSLGVRQIMQMDSLHKEGKL